MDVRCQVRYHIGVGGRIVDSLVHVLDHEFGEHLGFVHDGMGTVVGWIPYDVRLEGREDGWIGEWNVAP